MSAFAPLIDLNPPGICGFAPVGFGLFVPLIPSRAHIVRTLIHTFVMVYLQCPSHGPERTIAPVPLQIHSCGCIQLKSGVDVAVDLGGWRDDGLALGLVCMASMTDITLVAIECGDVIYSGGSL